jgi:GAF domain-containing protein
VLLARTPGIGSHLEDALRRKTTIDIGSSGTSSSRLLWQRLGLRADHTVCAPVHENGRYLGAIELARGVGQSAFSPAHVSALEYICEQFADFIADRPIDLTPDSLLPPAG